MVTSSPAANTLWRIVAIIVSVALTLIAFFMVLPIMAIAGVVLLGVAGFVGARAWLTRARRPNGVLDGRRNVRVVQRRPDDA